MAKLEPYAGDYYLWEYIPSLPASIIFLILFLAATAFHSWKAWTTRSRFCIPFCIGGLCTFPSPNPSLTHIQSTEQQFLQSKS